jgi:hypothetical protein
MSKQTKEVTKSTKKKVNWTATQLVGFWSLIILLSTFWAGTYVGTQATLNSQAESAKIKTQAVEDYKASLKVSQ